MGEEFRMMIDEGFQMTNEWAPIITAIANLGFSIVIAWYLLSKAIPRIQESFSKDLESQRKDAREALERIVALVSSGNTDLLKTIASKQDVFLQMLTINNEMVRALADVKELFRSK